MALKSTIFKAELTITDLDRHYYDDHALTIARHPSETDARMMLRVAAFALHADERLLFTKGLCADDEPELWQKSLSDEIQLWIDLGTPDEKRIKRACHRAEKVVIYAYGENSISEWWPKLENRVQRFDNLSIYTVDDTAMQQLAAMSRRTMQLQFTIQDQSALISDGAHAFSLTPQRLCGAL